MEPAADRRTLIEEIVVVLMLSLLSGTVRAIISLVTGPLSGVVVFASDQSARFVDQIVVFVFGLAPVLLVWHLVRRSGEGVAGIGLALDRPREDLRRGAALFVVVGIAGIGVYLAAVALGVNRFVVPVPPLGHWWTVPALVLQSAKAALVEEVIVLAYLVTRLQQLGWSDRSAIAASALLRGSYHLYQGWGGFGANLAMGLLFAWLFTKTKRAWPFVVAHFLLDMGAGIGFLLFRKHLPGF
jgi:membrane protease YdiL (CAAX protease family)